MSSISYSGTLAHHLAFGHALQIVIKTTDGASRCRISLLTSKLSKNAQADVGLNMTLYLREQCVGRNSRVHGIWGNEERHVDSLESANIASGAYFTCYIFCDTDRFHIAINNRPFCTFQYRLPVSALRAIELNDHIEVIKQVDHRILFPSPWPPIQSSDYNKAFSCDTPISFKPGHMLLITARCLGNKRGQFIIKFTNSDTQREDLHFNVRSVEKGLVIMNSMNKTLEFGEEVEHHGMPFGYNREFKLAIAFTDREFLFGMNGCHYTSFAYRNPDVLVNLVGFKITAKNGLEIQVTGVDHKDTHDPFCTRFKDEMQNW